MIAAARKEGKPIIVLAGRPYHVDPEVNHGIDQLIIQLGRGRRHARMSVSWHGQKFQTARAEPVDLPQPPVCRRQVRAPNSRDMNLVQLVSFGCGVDAITTDETREILQVGGKLYTQLKIDEITNLGAVNIRLRSLFAALEEQEGRP